MACTLSNLIRFHSHLCKLCRPFSKVSWFVPFNVFRNPTAIGLHNTDVHPCDGLKCRIPGLIYTAFVPTTRCRLHFCHVSSLCWSILYMVINYPVNKRSQEGHEGHLDSRTRTQLWSLSTHQPEHTSLKSLHSPTRTHLFEVSPLTNQNTPLWSGQLQGRI